MICSAVGIMFLPSRSGQRGAPVSSSAQEWDATDPSRLWAFRAAARREARSLRGSERTMTRRRGGRPKDPAMRRCKHSVKAPSTWGRWELQADKTVACGTQAFPAPEAAFAVCCSTSTRCHVPGKHMMPRAHPRGAAGAVKRPVFRTPLRGEGTRRPANPEPELTEG